MTGGGGEITSPGAAIACWLARMTTTKTRMPGRRLFIFLLLPVNCQFKGLFQEVRVGRFLIYLVCESTANQPNQSPSYRMLRSLKLAILLSVATFYTLQASETCNTTNCDEQGLFPILQNVTENSEIQYWYKCNERTHFWCVSQAKNAYAEGLDTNFGMYFHWEVGGCMDNETNRNLNATLVCNIVFHGATIFLSSGTCGDLILNSTTIESQGREGRLFLINIQEPCNTCTSENLSPTVTPSQLSIVSTVYLTEVVTTTTTYILEATPEPCNTCISENLSPTVTPSQSDLEVQPSTPVCPSITTATCSTTAPPTVPIVSTVYLTDVVTTTTACILATTPGAFESPSTQAVTGFLSAVAVIGIVSTIILGVLYYCHKGSVHQKPDPDTVHDNAGLQKEDEALGNQ